MELEETIHHLYGVSFSDNDKLSALVASKLDADLLVEKINAFINA